MNEENIQVITDVKELYDKCENMEQLFDKYYLPLLDKHYSKTYKLQQENKLLKEINEEHKKLNGELREENKEYKEVIAKAIKCIDYNIKYRNGADIYQFVDIESEILEPLKFILELDEENGNAYLKEFNDWLKEVE